MRRFRKALAVIPALALAFGLAACGGGTDADGAATNGVSDGGSPSGDGRTLTIAATTAEYGWNPADQPTFQNWAAEAIWDRLAYAGEDGTLVPDAAESFEILNENRTFRATLREGMYFSDGTPVDTAAVQKSFELVMTEGGATETYAGITFNIIDERTIEISWPEPQPTIDNHIHNVRIIAPAYLEAREWDEPIGSGPYVLDVANSTTGSSYTFTRNEDHWDVANYPFETVVIKHIESDAAVAAALQTGEIDAALVNVGSIEPVEAAGMEVMRLQGQTPRLILSDREGEIIPALGDVRVRQAMNMVWDKQVMADTLWQGNAVPTAQVFRPGSAAYIDDLEDPYPYDVERARALMAEAGFADGFDIELPTMTGQNFEVMLPYITQQLALINIRVTEVPLTGANAIGDLLSGQFPVVLWQLGNLGNSALQIFIESTPAGWWNLQSQPNEFVDSRWEQMATADAEESKRLQQEINQYIIDQAWFAPFVLTGQTFAFNPDVVSIPAHSDQEALTPRLRDFRQP